MRYRGSLTAILETSLDAVVVVNEQGLIQGWNRNSEQIFGRGESEVLDRPVTQVIVPPDYRPTFDFRLDQLAREPQDIMIGNRVERRALRRDGSEFPVELGVMITESEEGSRLLIGFIRDLTDERRGREEIEARTSQLIEAQEKLRASEETYRYVVELSSLTPWTADADGSILTVGERWTEWTGAPVAAALGQGWLDWVHPVDRPDVMQQWHDALRFHSRLEIDYRLKTQKGDYRWYHVRTTKRTDGASEGATWYGTLEDVHDQRVAEEASGRAQAELAHVSRLNAMGAMASVIAHDLNQPLTAAASYVRGCKQLLSANADVEAGVLDALNDADASIVRASDIVRRVREFVARGTVECQPESLVPLIEEACRFALSDATMRGITHKLKADGDHTVLVDRVQIQQVLVNLLRNAVEALSDRPRREIVISTGAAKDGFCAVAVCDTGRGLSPEIAAHMFDPFCTTREEGTGLGLSISRMIVEAHGGTIWNDTQPGQGTVIKFTLPCVPVG